MILVYDRSCQPMILRQQLLICLIWMAAQVCIANGNRVSDAVLLYSQLGMPSAGVQG